MDPPSDRLSPERPKRRLSSRPSSNLDSAGKRLRTGLDTSPTRASDPKDPSASEYQLRSSSSYRPTASHPRDVPAPSGSTTAYRQHTHSSSSSALSPGGSESASDDTALVDEPQYSQAPRRLSQSARLPHIPAPSSASTAVAPYLGPSWVTAETDPHRYQTQSSSTSSSSSSHRYHPNHPIETNDDRVHSPPPSLTLSTGQPLVNPPLKTQAAFVGKLYSMLEDEEIRKTGLIYWSAGGSTFTCPNPADFAKSVLPRFFKHNNWQSFVRQLNMYSFNKVNDLHATTTDSTAWEFRHPLFRQGESHLLASIKRKTTRGPTHTDGPLHLLSPSGDDNDSGVRTGGAMAGWMQDEGGGAPTSSPITTLPALPNTAAPTPQPRPEVFGYNLKTGEMIQSRPYEASSRSSSKTYAADLARLHGIRSSALPAISTPTPTPHPPQRPRAKRHHSDNDKQGPPVSSHPNRGSSSGYRHQPLESFPASTYSDSSQQYPQPAIPSPSPIMALTGQVAFLEERIAKLSDTLSVERVDNVRSHLDMLSYVASITLWLPNAPSRDITALQDALDRQTAELRHKYDALVASDALAHLASGSVQAESRRMGGLPRHFDESPGQRQSPMPTQNRIQTFPFPDQNPHRPSTGVSPHLPPLLLRRHTGTSSYTGHGGNGDGNGNGGTLPQMPIGHGQPPPLFNPTDQRPPALTSSYDLPPFSCSGLMHGPASSSGLTSLFGQSSSRPHTPMPAPGMMGPGRRASRPIVGLESGQDIEMSAYMISGDGRGSGVVEPKGMGWEEGGGNQGAGDETPKSSQGIGGAGIRNLLN